MIFQTAFSEKIRVESPVDSVSLTKTSFAEELDVNNVIKKYNKTGILQKAHDFEGVYGEFHSYDLREAIEMVNKAQDLFLEIPSDVRRKFNNDPGAFIDFATNPDNLEQMREWNLAPTIEAARQAVPEGTAPAEAAPEPVTT